jgi:DNA-binding NarL/FixJ family response regulator
MSIPEAVLPVSGVGAVHAPTIIVAEDHPMFRAALVLTLRRLMPEALLTEVASQGELEMALARGREVRLVLLDLRMPGAQGLSSLVFLRGEYPRVSVAIISGGAYSETIDRARRLGASAFIPKSAPVDTIAQALSCVIRGERWFPHDDAPAGRGGALQDQLTTLTAQQFRVLKYLADGLLNKQIADKLDVSEGTIRAHVTAILRKLRVCTRTQAVILVTEMDLQRDGADAL